METVGLERFARSIKNGKRTAVKLSIEAVFTHYDKQQIPTSRLNSHYTRAANARSKPPRLRLTAGSLEDPPHVTFFSDIICSICKSVISVNHSLAKMCFPLPRVHMCLHCGDRQKLRLTVVGNSVLAATETTGRLRAHLSHLYCQINGSSHKGRRRLIVLGLTRLLFQGFYACGLCAI